MAKNPWWRPSKIEKVTNALEKVLNKDINAVILTDEELFILVNEELEKNDRICYTTFKNYKADVKNPEKSEEIAIYEKFLSLYKKALLKQKADLFTKLHNDPQAWQRYAWIIERKFDAWNLRNIGVNKNDNTNLNLDSSDIENKDMKQLWAMRRKFLWD